MSTCNIQVDVAKYLLVSYAGAYFNGHDQIENPFGHLMCVMRLSSSFVSMLSPSRHQCLEDLDVKVDSFFVWYDLSLSPCTPPS